MSSWQRLAFRAKQFDPRSISGLFQWYDGSDRATLFDATSGGAPVADNAGVARWEDKSGNGYHLTQGTANNRPTLRPATRNGRSVLEYDGANSNLVSASIANDLSALSIFAVFSADTLGQNSLGAIWANNTAINLSGARQYRTQSGPTMAAAFGNNDSRNTATTYSLAAFTRYHVFWSGGTNRATDFSFLLNGSSLSPGLSGTLTTTAHPTGALAVGNTPGGTRAWDGFIAEVLVYTRLLSTSERTAVDRWLAGKWGF